MNPREPGYYTQGKKLELDWPEKDPAPLVVCTDPVPPDAPPARKPFLGLVRFAEAQGWEVRYGYSLGQARAVKKGTYKLVHTWGAWGRGYAWRWYAMHEWSPDLAAEWGWSRVAMWRVDGTPVALGLGTHFQEGNVTDLREWLRANGDTGPAWFNAVHARVQEQAERQKAKSKSTPKKAKEGAS